ncbi:DAK2 domain-containing protein [Ruminococcus sp.]|jgi:DAK2 domain fusion protein YloV|uniref:DAK2 domain-containing protein n=1 Tax=Ruminococcus sp. TaxID=41978 RepID=UPI0025E13089|nr:DAK2 domain-containing protein [Ruminococcus sp.]MCI2112526.1 DAK2 domain-containing protein [Ruminococcus sp.]MDD6988462.1 DAK2 domain-containing protein [Ruminococcus sp.]MDY6200775.1 DAK2 domain-containing protein [Ruminococcus sp.]
MINGQILKQAVISGANNISRRKNSINDLNIFPVPDGDTGTNMSMTVMSAAKALEEYDGTSAGEAAGIVASAMLRGARGNSGVITSLIFRGFAQGLKDMEEVNGKNLAAALGIGVDAAYKAVMKPTEGTILTVARMAYEAGVEAAKEDSSTVFVWQAICDKANEALAITPELLPVLKKAGVVDAGGKGLCVIFEGMLSVIKDGVMVEYDDSAEVTVDTFDSAAAEFDEDINFTYCTEFIVGRNPEEETDPQLLRDYLETIGDCVVVVSDEEIIKVHVHTEQPGNALTKGLEFGQLLTTKVENMKEQHKNVKKSKKVEKETFTPAEPVDDIGFVAVAAGEGLKELFKDLGCTNVVSGGQSMNPSTDDIYEAVMATPAKNVIVLPNNKNIVLAAEQTVPMVTDRNVVIVPTRTIPQGMTAMLNFDPEISAESNAQLMMDSAQNVGTGLVTFAARSSEFGGKKIKEGDIIALENGKLTITEKSAVKALIKLAKNMVNRDTSFITLIYGEEVSEEDANKAYEELRDKFGSRTDISLVKGDQPVYYFILSVE